MFCLVQKLHLFSLLRRTLLIRLILFLKAPFEVELSLNVTCALLCKREEIEGVCDRVGINQIILSFNISTKSEIMFL